MVKLDDFTIEMLIIAVPPTLASIVGIVLRRRRLGGLLCDIREFRSEMSTEFAELRNDLSTFRPDIRLR